MKLNTGDVVRLKSGGAPLTIARVHTDGTLLLVAISSGGLLSETMVDPTSVWLWNGDITPAHPERRNR